MRNVLVGVIISMASLAVTAQGLVTTAPIRFASGKLVMVGDSEGKVIATVGRAPDREVTLETGAGGAVGQRWIFIEPGYSGRVVTIELYGGKVARLWSERLQ